MEKEFEKSFESPKGDIEETKVELKPVLPVVIKKSAKLIMIRKGFLILEDAEGNGISIPLTPEYKNKKIGDIVYF